MIIKALQVKRFRCLENESIPCDKLTALVGANGAGKSSFLRALDLFYNSTPKINTDDFYAGDPATGAEVVVSLTFDSLSEQAKSVFSSYIEGEELTVERVFSFDDGRISAKYHSASLQHNGFDTARAGFQVKDRGKTARAAYDELCKQTEYSALPEWSTLAAAADALKGWEAAHPDKCTRQRDDGQFFGFSEVAQGYLGKFTRMLFIPAVRDAADDAAEGRNTVLSGLMDLVVRSVLANKDALKKLKETTQAQFSEILDPTKLTELGELAERLTATLKTFVPEASIDLKWLPLQALDFPLPKADVKLVEDGYPCPVAHTGHGLQRAFILTMLQHLALAQVPREVQVEDGAEAAPENLEKKLPDLVLAIEEPELYQHPNRQRHFAKILLQLAGGKTPGVAERTQVLYSTHSPLFVGIDRMEQIRLLRKISVPGRPKMTRSVYASSNEIASILWAADGSRGPMYTGDSLMPRLTSIMTPWMSEGFFAHVAVLVEGEDDRAALLGMAKQMNIDLESAGISVIPCGGKTSMDRPAAIFRRLGIPIYMVWDGDKGEKDAKPEDNHRLLRLLDRDPIDWPSEVSTQFAVFGRNLETTLREELGADDFDRWLTDCQENLRIPKRKHALKNPEVIATIIQAAVEEGKASRSLQHICTQIGNLV